MFEKGDIMETIRNVDVNRLHDFKNHPFKVEMNTELCELMRSIEKEGVLVPLLVRTNPYGDGYEVISGHRRKEAAIWAGETKVPVVIRELDDDQAVVAMVDSNLHRENLKPSEKAFAYKMKLDAMKHQGKHLDSGALAQVGPKFTDGSQLNEKGNNTSTINSNELLARQVGESVAQIKRYIRLTKLIPKIKKNEITEKVRYSIDLYGDRPDLLASIIKLAIAVLELLINRIMLAAVGVAEKMLDIVSEESRNIEAKTYPTMSPLAKKYLSLQNIYDELQKQNEAIFAQEHKRSELEIELSECNGAFKARKRGGLQNQIYELNKQIDNMKRYLSSIVQRHGYDNVRDFYSTYYAAKGEYADYVKDVEEWNVNHVKKNENIPTEENRTDRYQIGEERDKNRYMDRNYVEKKR